MFKRLFLGIVAALAISAGAFSPLAMGAGTLSLMGVGAGSSGGIALTFHQSGQSVQAAAASWTIANIPIGAARPDRYVVIDQQVVTSACTTPTNTIGGVTATRISSLSGTSQNVLLGAIVPTGTTASLVTTCTTGTTTGGIYNAYTVTGYSSVTPVGQTAVSSVPVGTPGFSLPTAAGGVAIATLHTSQNASGQTATLGGMGTITSTTNDVANGANFYSQQSGMTTATTGANISITGTCTNPAICYTFAASWQ